MDNRSGIEFSISLMRILKSAVDVTESCGTPAGHGLTDDRVAVSLTCYLLSSRGRLYQRRLAKTVNRQKFKNTPIHLLSD